MRRGSQIEQSSFPFCATLPVFPSILHPARSPPRIYLPLLPSLYLGGAPSPLSTFKVFSQSNSLQIFNFAAIPSCFKLIFSLHHILMHFPQFLELCCLVRSYLQTVRRFRSFSSVPTDFWVIKEYFLFMSEFSASFGRLMGGSCCFLIKISYWSVQS